MPYCLSCGKLRPTNGGMCEQCRIDFAVRKKMDAKADHRRIMRGIAREKRREKNGPEQEK